MNKVDLIGRISKKLELKPYITKDKQEKKYVNFDLAVKSDLSNKVDFITCVAFDRNAENICNFAKQGVMLALSGKIVPTLVDGKDNKKVKVSNVVVSYVEFLEYVKTADEKKSENEAEEKVPDSFIQNDNSYDGYAIMSQENLEKFIEEYENECK